MVGYFVGWKLAMSWPCCQ